MKSKDIYDVLCSILDEMGFVIFESEDDFDISEYIVDSLQFISFIIEIEKKLSVDLPDDFLLYEILNSAVGLSNKISDFLSGDKS